jgi:hypothetical protein
MSSQDIISHAFVVGFGVPARDFVLEAFSESAYIWHIRVFREHDA